MRFAKVVFLIAGIYSLLILTLIYFMEGKIGRKTPPAITHPEYFYGFLGAGLIWQILFLVLSKDPVQYRAAPGVLHRKTRRPLSHTITKLEPIERYLLFDGWTSCRIFFSFAGPLLDWLKVALVNLILDP